jgi:hypothetical protein
MGFFQSLGVVALLIVMPNSRARYRIMAFALSFRISPETLSGRTELFLPIAVNFLLMILVIVAEVIRQREGISDIFSKPLEVVTMFDCREPFHKN